MQRHLCETRHGYLHVRSAGEGGVPLVLLHFTPLSSLAFEPTQKLLASDRLVLAVDRLGYGMSDPPRERLDMAEYAHATLDALESLGVTRFDLVGHHTGALEALEIATAHPDRVRRLVLSAIPVFTEDEQERTKARLAASAGELEDDGSHLVAMWNRVKASGEGRYPDWDDPDADWVNPSAPGAEGGWPLERRQEFVTHFLLAGPTWTWALFAVFDYPVAERLPRVRQPLLVLRTQDDIWRQTARTPGVLPPQATHVDLPHLDILAFALGPDELAVRIREFLDA